MILVTDSPALAVYSAASKIRKVMQVPASFRKQLPLLAGLVSSLALPFALPAMAVPVTEAPALVWTPVESVDTTDIAGVGWANPGLGTRPFAEYALGRQSTLLALADPGVTQPGPSSLLADDLANNSDTATVPGLITPSYSAGPELWGRLFSGEVYYVLDFVGMARLHLGESLWTVFEVGQSPSNDLVIGQYSFTYNNVGFNVDIRGWHAGQLAYVYLDADGGGLGVCEQPGLGLETEVDRSYPESTVNRCFSPASFSMGESDYLEIRVDQDVWIRDIHFQAAQGTDGSLFRDAVQINEGLYRFSDDLGAGAEYAWLPVGTFFLRANTALRLGWHDEDLLVTRLGLYVAEPGRAFTMAALTIPEDSNDPPAPIPEPPVITLLLLGFVATLAARLRWRRPVLSGADRIS